MKVLNEYPSHHYIEEYEKTELFCPKCGVKAVWEEQGSGDYYVGVQYVCTNCSYIFTIQDASPFDGGERIARIVEQLSKGVTFNPVTKGGN